MASKWNKWFTDKKDQIKTAVRFEKKFPFYFLSITLIIIISVLIRLTPVINDVYLIKAFDPWIQYHSTEYIIENGWYEFFNWIDYKSWYPTGIDRGRLRPGLLGSAALFYRVISALGIPITPYEACFYFPAFMGGLTVLVMYFLGKEVLDKKTGLIAAFFLAVNPGHMQRTVIGFFDNETVGVFGVLMVLLFFMKSVKSGKMIHGVIAGCSLGYLSLSWGGLSFPFLLIPLLSLFLILLNRYDGKLLVSYALTEGLGIFIYVLNKQWSYEKMFNSIEVIVPLGWLAFLIFYHMFYIRKGTGLYEKMIKTVKWGSIPVAIVFAIIFWYYPDVLPFNLGSRIYSIINPNIRESMHIVASVGEHMPSPWSVFYSNSLICLLLVIPGFYFAFRRNSVDDILMVIFVLTLFYFTGSMIRIILLFAPAVSLIAAYALSNILKFFGNLMQKEKKISRRRKRQLKRTVGKPEGIVAYTVIAILLFVQVNHAVKISTQQMGYSELVAGGTYHDWEEALTWMKYNIHSTSPVVSWWDYGYWITVIGNSTSVNDNATFNGTRIGLTGMAMMQTNERYSAEIFRRLRAEYVLVYFGHLINGLGGDEGKWPWMLRICNDHTDYYRDTMDLYKDNWYSTSQVFNEAEYINSSSGQYESKWFDSTLVKLMFNDEPTTMSAATQTQTGAYFAAQIAGYEQSNIQPRKDDNGNLWSTHIPENGQYDFQFFEKEYYSTNRLVKIYEVDYTALDSSIVVSDPYMEDNGLGFAKIKNSGEKPLTIGDVSLNGQLVNKTIEKSTIPINPDEERYIWFNANENNGNFTETNEVFNVEVEANVERDDGRTYSFSNSSNEVEIINNDELKLNSDIKINKNGSRLFRGPKTGQNEVEAFIEMENTGDKPILLDNMNIQSGPDEIRTKNSTFIRAKNQDVKSESWDEADYTSTNFLVTPGEKKIFRFVDSVPPLYDDFRNTRNISISTKGDIYDAISLSFDKKGYNLDILSDKSPTYLPEKEFLYDYNNYQYYSQVDQRYYLDYSDSSYLLENGDLKLTIKNNGEDSIALQNLFINDLPIDNNKWTTLGGNEGFFVDKGETTTVSANGIETPRNEPVKITITGENNETCTSATTFMIPTNQSSMIDIYNKENSATALLTNETIRLVVKNLGIDPIELDSVLLNNSETISIEDDYIIKGDNLNSKRMEYNDVAVLNIPIPESKFKINMSNELTVKLQTNVSGAYSEVNLQSKLPSKFSPINFNLLTEENDGSVILEGDNLGWSDADSINNDLHGLIGIGLENIDSVQLDSIWINTSSTGGYQYVPDSEIEIYDDNDELLDEWILECGDPYPNVNLYTFDISLDDALGLNFNEEDSVWVNLITKEGYEIKRQLTA